MKFVNLHSKVTDADSNPEISLVSVLPPEVKVPLVSALRFGPTGANVHTLGVMELASAYNLDELNLFKAPVSLGVLVLVRASYEPNGSLRLLLLNGSLITPRLVRGPTEVPGAAPERNLEQMLLEALGLALAQPRAGD